MLLFFIVGKDIEYFKFPTFLDTFFLNSKQNVIPACAFVSICSMNVSIAASESLIIMLFRMLYRLNYTKRILRKHKSHKKLEISKSDIRPHIFIMPRGAAGPTAGWKGLWAGLAALPLEGELPPAIRVWNVGLKVRWKKGFYWG
jgi:hypothetical protein